MDKLKDIIIFILVVACIVLGYLAFRNKETEIGKTIHTRDSSLVASAEETIIDIPVSSTIHHDPDTVVHDSGVAVNDIFTAVATLDTMLTENFWICLRVSNSCPDPRITPIKIDTLQYRETKTVVTDSVYQEVIVKPPFYKTNWFGFVVGVVLTLAAAKGT